MQGSIIRYTSDFIISLWPKSEMTQRTSSSMRTFAAYWRCCFSEQILQDFPFVQIGHPNPNSQIIFERLAWKWGSTFFK